MTKTPSTMLPLGTHAPHFSLLDPASGKTINLNGHQNYVHLQSLPLC